MSMLDIESIHTSQRTQVTPTTKTSHFVSYTEIIALYWENQREWLRILSF